MRFGKNKLQKQIEQREKELEKLKIRQTEAVENLKKKVEQQAEAPLPPQPRKRGRRKKEEPVVKEVDDIAPKEIDQFGFVAGWDTGSLFMLVNVCLKELYERVEGKVSQKLENISDEELWELFNQRMIDKLHLSKSS